MSRPSEPVETVSTSIDLSFLPSRMIEPLPKLRSIWESAASRAFDLSMEEPSTRRNAVVVIAPTPYRTGFAGPTTKGPAGEQCTRFVLSSQYVLFRFEGTGRSQYPLGRWPLRRIGGTVSGRAKDGREAEAERASVREN